MIQPVYRWSGRIPTACLDDLPAEFRDHRMACIQDVRTWTRIWQRWQGDTTQPRINFNRQLVVLVRNVEYLNRIRFVSASLDNEQLTIETVETRTARPIRHEVYGLMLVFSTDGIASISDGSEVVSLEASVGH